MTYISNTHILLFIMSNTDKHGTASTSSTQNDNNNNNNNNHSENKNEIDDSSTYTTVDTSVFSPTQLHQLTIMFSQLMKTQLQQLTQGIESTPVIKTEPNYSAFMLLLLLLLLLVLLLLLHIN